MKTPVKTLAGEAAGDVDLDDAIYGVALADIRRDLLHRVVRWQLAKRRAGTHSTLERGQIARTKAKSVRQKGSGGARHGAKSAGIFRGGAKATGPKPRDYTHALPKKVRRMALSHALSAKAAAKELIVLDAASLAEPKTKAAKEAFVALGARRALVVDGAQVDENFARAVANIPDVDVLPASGLNVYDVLRHDHLVVTKAGLEAIDAYFAGKGWPASPQGGPVGDQPSEQEAA